MATPGGPLSFADLYQLYQSTVGPLNLEQVLGGLHKRQQQLGAGADASLAEFRRELAQPTPAATPDVPALVAAGSLLAGGLAQQLAPRMAQPSVAGVLTQQQQVNREEIARKRLANLQVLHEQYQEQARAAMTLGNQIATAEAQAKIDQNLKQQETVAKFLEGQQRQAHEREIAGISRQSALEVAGIQSDTDIIQELIRAGRATLDFRSGELIEVKPVTDPAEFSKQVQAALEDFPAAVKHVGEKQAGRLTLSRVMMLGPPPDLLVNPETGKPSIVDYERWIGRLLGPNGKPIYDPKNKEHRAAFNAGLIISPLFQDEVMQLMRRNAETEHDKQVRGASAAIGRIGFKYVGKLADVPVQNVRAGFWIGGKVWRFVGGKLVQYEPAPRDTTNGR